MSDTYDAVAWFENDQWHSFLIRYITSTLHDPTSVFAIDIDEDGTLDALTTSSEDDTVTIYYSDASPFSTTEIITTMAEGAKSVFAAASADINH